MIILDRKLREDIDHIVYPKRLKRCTFCDKPLGTRNQSMLCNYHYHKVRNEKKKAERIVKNLKEIMKHNRSDN